VNGTRKFSFVPLPQPSDGLHTLMAETWPAFSTHLIETRGGQPDTDDESELTIRRDVKSVDEFLETKVANDDLWDRVRSYTRFTTLDKAQHPRAQVIREWLDFASPTAEIETVIRESLGIISPEFALFSSAERAINSEYLIDDPETLSSVALTNLLQVADLSIEKIQKYRLDSGYVAQLIDEANGRLDQFFSTRWSQESITVGLKVDGDFLRVHVKDKRDNSVGWLDITERSEGLRVFVALATFLAKSGFETPPILLIDEAEQHLHLNAQADLVRMLQDLDQIQQVIYTTHSPGCLPADLGNGVRFVEPADGGVSTIRHDFWSIENHTHVGFNPLLIVMGAAAAAFSGLRNALLVEGASDMLLLPTLIKLATTKAELDYQVAPGISAASKTQMGNLDTVASKVAFLVDGDDGGRIWKEQLIRAQVPDKRIKKLPIGLSLEDLLDRDYYFDTLNELIRADRIRYESVGADQSLKLETNAWAKREGLVVPGAIAVAELILGNHESGARPIELNNTHKKTLQGLDTWAIKTFSS
jgi:hypothetical protein